MLGFCLSILFMLFCSENRVLMREARLSLMGDIRRLLNVGRAQVVPFRLVLSKQAFSRKRETFFSLGGICLLGW